LFNHRVGDVRGSTRKVDGVEKMARLELYHCRRIGDFEDVHLTAISEGSRLNDEMPGHSLVMTSLAQMEVFCLPYSFSVLDSVVHLDKISISLRVLDESSMKYATASALEIGIF